MIRAFIAFELPKHITDHLASVQKEIRSYGFSAKWVRPENIHLTLKFLGNINPADTDAVIGAASRSVRNHSAIQLSVKGIGAFPDVKRPRVIWSGMKGETFRLIEFQKELEANLETVGYPKEKKAFKAHLTIARIKDKIDSRKLIEAVCHVGDIESESFTADEIILFKSDLKPSGPVYTKLKTIRMGF